MLSESGIDLDFDVFAEIEQDHQCYEVKARSLAPSRSNPFVLMDPDMVKVKPDPDGICNTMNETSSIGPTSLTRTNFKLQLQREQLLEAEKKEKQRLKVLAAQCEKSSKFLPPGQTQSRLMFPNASSSVTQSLSMPMKIKANIPQNLPSSVLKVETSLKNPTQYYIKQQQKRQVREYLSSQQCLGNSMPISAPSNLHNFNFNSDVSSPSFLNPPSFISPSSPSASSIASGSEVDSVLDDLFGLETATDHDFNMFSDTVFSTTLPTTNNLFENYGINTLQNHEKSELSASCPNVKLEDDDNLLKERQKKDNHNMIERRRRYNINDRIKELGTLVPKLDNDFKQNKGTILKSSVDYIRRLKKDRDRLKSYETRSQDLEDMNKKLMLRVQELELILRAANISTTLPEPDLSAASSPQLTQLLVGNQLRQQTQQQQNHLHQKLLQQQYKNLHGNSTLHSLLKSSSGNISAANTSSNNNSNNSLNSPENNDMKLGSPEDEDCVIMES